MPLTGHLYSISSHIWKRLRIIRKKRIRSVTFHLQHNDTAIWEEHSNMGRIQNTEYGKEIRTQGFYAFVVRVGKVSFNASHLKSYRIFVRIPR